MANRIPLIVNPDVSQIQELPASDTLFIANDVDLNGSMDISTALTLSSNATASTRFVVSFTNEIGFSLVPPMWLDVPVAVNC